MGISTAGEGKTWVATYQNLFQYDSTKRKLVEFSDLYPAAQITAERIMSFAASGDDIWIGYRSTGLEHIQSQTMPRQDMAPKEAFELDLMQ